MEIFIIHDLVNAARIGIKSYIEVNGIFAAAILDVVLKPFINPTTANLVAAMGAGVILWRKKSWFFNGLLQIFQSK